jgi:CheY-like chemotaxis protein
MVHSFSQRILERLLNNVGVKTIVAEDGESAIEIVRTWECPINAILMDMQLPGMSGSEAAHQIRSIEQSRNNNTGEKRLKIIGISGDTRQEAINDSSLDCFVVKPWKQEDIYKSLGVDLPMGSAGSALTRMQSNFKM